MTKYHLNFVLLFGAYGFSFLYIAWRHFKNIRDGGHRYLQGDWMINFADGPVRRGFSGEFILGLGEIAGVSPLVLLGLVQIAVLALVVGTLLQLALARGLTDGLTLALLSPALVLFWVNDEYTAFRKELLGYLVFVPLFLGRRGPVTSARLAITTLLLAVAVLFHEANAVFFAPLGLVFYLLLDRRRALRWILIAGLITLAATAFSLIYMSVPGVENMCQRLLDAGASPEICRGSMTWLDKDLGEVVAGGQELVAIWGGPRNFLLAAGLAVCLFGSVVWLLKGVGFDREGGLVLCAGVASVLPMYFLGGDWGRWVSIQMFVMLFLLLALSEKREAPTIGHAVPVAAYLGVLAFDLSVGVFHMVPTPMAGFAQTAVGAVRNFLN